MTANTQTKAVPKWKLWLRRLTKPRPYWQKRLEDQVEPANSLQASVFRVLSLCLDYVGLLIGAGLFLALYVAVVVGPVFFSPGFFENGLADPIGRYLAGICLGSGYCDLRYLLAGVSVGVPIIAATIILTLGALFSIVNAPDDEDEVSEPELYSALTVLDERLVHLRADLVLAGVLPLSPEEKAEVEDAPAPRAEPSTLGGMLLLDPTLISPQTYTRPELTKEHQAEAGMLAVNFTNNRSTAQIRQAVAVLLCENQRLTLEANEHRAARGIEPLPTFKAGK